MTWILPILKAIPAGGKIRCVGRFDRKTYDRAYYHAKRKGRKQTYTPAQQARRRELRMVQYRANAERERANARARYWKYRDTYAEASRERQRALRSKLLSEGDSGKRGFPVRAAEPSGEAVRASLSAECNPKPGALVTA